jgi:uncharacterized protein
MNQKDGNLWWAEAGVRMQTRWRKELHRDFDRALANTNLLQRPDYEAANRFLVKARREMANHG